MPGSSSPPKTTRPVQRRWIAAGALAFCGMAAIGAWVSRDLDGRIAKAEELERRLGKPVGPDSQQSPRVAAAAEGTPPNPAAFRRFLLYGIPLYVVFLATMYWAWRRWRRRLPEGAA